MFIEQYREKLSGFNRTEKYHKEMEFMSKLMDISSTEKVLDFGCGIGTMRDYLYRTTRADVRGYDRYCYLDKEPDWFNHSFFFQFDIVYFMHSFAHLENVEWELKNLKQFLRSESELYVLTPNLDWIRAQKDSSYRPDPTVVSHFNCNSLKKVFEDNGFEVDYCGQFGAYSSNSNERVFLKAIYK